MMWPFRRRSHRHHWGMWQVRYTPDEIWHRSCRCGAIQRHDIKTGHVTIWAPDGVDSGLLDRGLTRQILEDL